MTVTGFTVDEVPQQLEPVTSDPFIAALDEAAGAPAQEPQPRSDEPARRTQEQR